MVSGDGFVTLGDGSVRWGRFGAAGVLARTLAGDGSPWYFVARRSAHCHQGGTWAVPGGALRHGETPLAAALREFAEETGVELAGFALTAIHEDDHGGWSYWTVVVDVPEPFAAPAPNWETAETRWVPATGLAELELLEPFRQTILRLGLAEGL